MSRYAATRSARDPAEGADCTAATKLLRHLRQQPEGFDGLSPQVKRARFDFRRDQYLRLVDPHNVRGEERLLVCEIDDPKALFTLQDDVMSAIRRVDVTQDVRDGTYTMQVDGGGFRPVRRRAASECRSDVVRVALAGPL